MKSRIVLAVLSIVILTTTAFAADPAMVEIKSRSQAQFLVEQGLTAHTRIGNRLLITLSPDEQERLDEAGIAYEVIVSDADPSNTALVIQHDRAATTKAALEGLGVTYDIGAGLHLAPMGPSSAREISQTSKLSATLLSDLEVPIEYWPTTVPALPLMDIDYPTDSLADLISQDSLFAYDVRLEEFNTRYIFTDSIDRARDWIAQKFMDWGYTDVSTPTFYWNGTHYNVMCVKQGYAEPDKVIVIGGHYDSITYGEEPGPEFYAPGADDDASGVALTMELARVLSGVPTRKTIIFMAFSAEEVGLVGSRAAAQGFLDAGVDVEVMFNYDMVAYVEEAHWPLDLSGGPQNGYMWLSHDAAQRLTNLTPVATSMGASSDHYSFYERGFNVCNNIEGNFNNGGWHTNLDIHERLNFDFFTDVARMAVASVAIAANAASPTEIEQLVDVGDGQSLELYWDPCLPEYEYTVLYGVESGVYTDTVEIIGGACSTVLSGLVEGQQYHMSVVGVIPDGYPAVYGVEDTLTPLSIPRTPAAVSAEPGLNTVVLDWAESIEGDFSHYRIYRQIEDFQYQLLADNVTTSEYLDEEVVGQIWYSYRIAAVDMEGNESELSEAVVSTAATFDGGVLVVDEWSSTTGSPAQGVQEEYIDSLLGPLGHHLARVDSSGESLTASQAGPYSSILWIDDDVGNQWIERSEETLRWYAGFPTNLMVEGFQTVQFWVASPTSPGDFIRDYFRIGSWTDHPSADFTGATGAGSWPDIDIGTNSLFGDLIPSVPTFDLISGGQAIYLYDSESDNPASEGLCCGVAYETDSAKYVLLGFPLYWLTEESAQALVAHAMAWFDEGGGEDLPGDVDGNAIVDIADLVYLISWAFLGGSPPVDINRADVNGSCVVDISDIVYMVEYMFLGGTDLQPGCVR